MPTIRCSNEVYRLLQARALQRGEPASIILDRVIWGLDTLTPQPKPEIEAKPEIKAKPEIEAKPEPELWPWTRPRGVNYKCGKCGWMVDPELKEGHEKFCREHHRGKTSANEAI